MSAIACRLCGESYDGRQLAWCPACLGARWLRTPRLLRPKHDPDAAPEARDRYRSILTPHAKSQLARLLDDCARKGHWYWDRDYGFWVHVTCEPLGRAPGVGIPAGRSEPDHALSCLFIAEADSRHEAHVFAADDARHAAQVRAGVFEPLGVCLEPGCDNLRGPGRDGCAIHDAVAADPCVMEPAPAGR